MIIFKLRSRRSSIILALLACLAFIAAAILAWDLPVSEALKFLMMCLLMLVVLVAAAALLVVLIKLVQNILGKK